MGVGQTHVIAIDGPAGAGKSTVAKALARRLGYSFLDTGAMYRALTLKALKAGIDLNDQPALITLAKNTVITLQGEEEIPRVFLDGKDVTRDIRDPNVTLNTSAVAVIAEIRSLMVKWQRAIAAKQNVVVEGRDVTTVVFPQTPYKFYLDADVGERTARRLKDLEKQGKTVEAEQLMQEIKTRDHLDSTRAASPLVKAEGVTVVDSTGLSIEQTAEKILELMNKL